MGKTCCVPLCPTKHSTSNVSFHEIPVEPELRASWLKNVSRAATPQGKGHWAPSDFASVCSRHFLETDYIHGAKQRRLKKTAVPTIFKEFPAYLQPKVATRKAPTPRSSILPRNPKKKRIPLAVNNENQIVPGESKKEDSCCSKEQRKCKIFEQRIQSQENTIAKLKARIHQLQNNINYKNKIIAKSRLKSTQMRKSTTSKQSDLEKQVDKIKRAAEFGNTKAVMLLQQLNAFGKMRFRWSDFSLRMCTVWRYKSPKSYTFARKNFLNLPARSTLQKYVGPSSLETGISSLGMIRLKEELENLTEPQRLCSLIFDEMSLQERLQYCKQADKLVGTAEVGRNVTEDSPQLANRLLCFVLKGLSINYRVPVAYYLVKQLQGHDLHNLIKKVIVSVEEVGFKICRLVCDDAKINVKALELLCGGQLSYKINHIVRSGEPLFISFDSCHILKNIRNQFLDDERQWRIGGEVVSSKPIKQLHNTQKDLPIKPVRFLNRKVVYPTSFEKMNVKRAVQIFSTEVNAALELFAFKNIPGFRNMEKTLEFMKNIRKWFNVLNVSNLTQHKNTRNDQTAEFWNMEDSRLIWLEEDFLNYLSQWKESVAELPKSRNGKQQFFLTRETYTAIKITTLAAVGCIRYLLECGLQFVLTRKMSSDDIEGLFSAVRSAQGYNDQANAAGSIYALERIIKTGIFTSSAYGNTSNVEHDTISSCSSSRVNVLKRKLPDPSLITLSAEQITLLSKLNNPPKIHTTTTKNCGIAMVCGFMLRLIKDKHQCSMAGVNLRGSPNVVCNKLISLQDRGGLLYPTDEFVSFVSLILDVLGLSRNQNTLPSLVKSWKTTLLHHLPPKSLSCGCGKVEHDFQLRELVLGSICKIYFQNTGFVVTDRSNTKPKYSFPPLSKKMKKL